MTDAIHDGLRGWTNGFFDRPRDVILATPLGPLRVTSDPSDSRTRWAIAIAAPGVDVALTQASVTLRGFKRVVPGRRWSTHAGLRVCGQPDALARHLAELPTVGGALVTWRAFELEVHDGAACLTVPTTNIDASDAEVGARVVLAAAQLLVPR